MNMVIIQIGDCNATEAAKILRLALGVEQPAEESLEGEHALFIPAHVTRRMEAEKRAEEERKAAESAAERDYALDTGSQNAGAAERGAGKPAEPTKTDDVDLTKGPIRGRVLGALMLMAMSTEELAAKLGLEDNQVYQACHSLKKEDRIVMEQKRWRIKRIEAPRGDDGVDF